MDVRKQEDDVRPEEGGGGKGFRQGLPHSVMKYQRKFSKTFRKLTKLVACIASPYITLYKAQISIYHTI